MSVRRRRRNPLTRFIAPVATIAMLSYFGFHALNGQYGLRAQMVLSQTESDLRLILAERKETRAKLESQLALLQDGTMNRDMVDEHARRELNLLRNEEMVIFFD